MAQFAAAGIAIAAGLRVELIGNDLLATIVAVVWLVGITNAFNLLDNMDGLAATLAAVACGYFAIDAATLHEDELVLALALSLGFACVGFLPYNLRPGRRAAVFMGDSGSQVLGFMLAALALASSWTTAGTTVATMLLPLLVLAIPILDTTLVTVARLAERRPVTQGGRDHSSHRLVYYGLSESRAVALLAMIAIALGATGVAYNVLDEPRLTAVGVVLTFVLLVQFGGFLTELSELSRRGEPGDTSLRHAFTLRAAPAGRGARRLRADQRLVPRLVPARDRRQGNRAAARTFLAALPVVLGMTYVAFVGFRIYRRVWRYATARDALAIALACFVSDMAALAIVAATRPLGDFPARIFLVDAVVCTAAVTFSRLVLRLGPTVRALRRRGSRRRVLVVGAGRAGRSLVRELREDPDARVVGFLDDNLALRRRRIQGVTVLGTTDEVGHGAGDGAAGRGARLDPERAPRTPGCGRPGLRRGAGTVPLRAPAHRDAIPVGRSDRRVSARHRRGGSSRLDTLIPLLFAYCALAALYVWQAWRRETPTIFTDELELTQISRAIADTGEPARRGVAYGFTSLVPWLTAPAWWLNSVVDAFEAVKYLQALVMTTAIFPAYALARLVVSRPWALFAAVASVAAPALAYAPILVEEPVRLPGGDARPLPDPPRRGGAEPAFRAARLRRLRARLPRALAARRRVPRVGALARRPGVALAAGAGVGARRGQAGTGSEPILLALGAVFLFSALMSTGSDEWARTTNFYKGRIIDYGLWATGAFTIGVGILPVIAALAGIVRRRSEVVGPAPARLRDRHGGGVRDVRLVRGGQGRVPLDDVLQPRRRAQSDLPRPCRVRRHGRCCSSSWWSAGGPQSRQERSCSSPSRRRRRSSTCSRTTRLRASRCSRSGTANGTGRRDASMRRSSFSSSSRPPVVVGLRLLRGRGPRRNSRGGDGDRRLRPRLEHHERGVRRVRRVRPVRSG